MKKSLKVIILIVIVAIAIVTFIIVGNQIQKKRDARPFAPYDFPKTMIVENGTSYVKADTIALYLAHHILKLDTFNLIITYIPESIKSKDIEIYAIVQYMPFKKNQFLILLERDEMSLETLKMSLSHEFVHVDQYLKGDLVIYPGFAVWKGEPVYFNEIPYEDRPFEMDAFKRQNKYLKELNKILYNE